MGAGGFFNYEKPGPGIKKDGPQKKGFFVFFEIWFRNFWKLITVNFMYSIFKVLIIPAGFAEAGMTNVARNLARDKHSFGVSDFYETIKKNWKQALPAGIINTVITLLLGFAIYFYIFGKDLLSILGFGFSVALFITFTFMKYHVWLMIITFKDLTLKNIYKNSFLFVFLNFKVNFLIGITELAITIGLILLFAVPYYIVWTISLFLAVFIVPGFINLMRQTLIFPKVKKYMIDPYYEEHPGEDIEQRRNLGLEIEDEEKSVFEDNTTNPEETE